MADANEKWVVREGRDWMELRKVDPRGRLWVVLGGTVGLPGDVVRFPRLRRFAGTGTADREAPLSPFEAEIVVDMITRTILLPESGKPFNPLRRTLKLMKTLEAAGLKDQARVVWEWLGPAMDGLGKDERDAA